MPTPATSDSVIRQLQLVFSFSVLLLLLSLVASFYSIQKLITNSERVNQTNQVLIEAENVISGIKDAETGQRGFLLTLNPLFLQPYNGSYGRVVASYNRVRDLTIDNPAQQENLAQAKALYETEFSLMRRSIAVGREASTLRRDTVGQYGELVRGKKTMDQLRVVVNRLKAEEQRRLRDRIEQQQIYINNTPFLLVAAALISILITVFAYRRIRKDVDERIAERLEAEEKYAETTGRIAVMKGVTRKITDGDYAARSPDQRDDELGQISGTLNRMAESLERTFTDLNDRNWLQTGTAALSDAIRGEKELNRLANRLIDTLADYLHAPLGTVYLAGTDGNFKLTGSYAASQAPTTLKAGEGLPGQAIARKKTIIVHDVPADYGRITSSLGESRPVAVVITPLIHNNVCVGVIELGLLHEPEPLEIDFLEQNREALAIGINAALDYVRLQNFLEETQVQAEELQAQHTEMETLNADLELQALKLQASEEELRVQQEELQETNTELEERGLLLEERNNEIQQKADELEQATRYKSEFLANMSHELRTPLNSILLLSRLLSENLDKNLNDDQIEYASVIRASGNGLLGLIDEILDLSKIEAGQMHLDYQAVALAEITNELQTLFGVVAKAKGLNFRIVVADGVPTLLATDKLRLGQILKNLIANALKFTADGSVTLTIHGQPTEPTNDVATGFSAAIQPDALCFVVSDTGIGIAPDKQPLVFEAFQQADGSTKRKYGGTGLGLSISRELAKLLGGEITLKSQVDQGSEFTLRLPISFDQPATPAGIPMPDDYAGFGNYQHRPLPPPPTGRQPPLPGPATAAAYVSPTIPAAVPDDRNGMTAGDKVILIVEDDTRFAQSLLDYARQRGYKGIVAVRGDEGLSLAARYLPRAILLDIQLPVMSGWEVMDALKANPLTRPIPVHIMSSHSVKNESLRKGAIDFVAKPLAFDQLADVFKRIDYVLARDPKKVLIVEDSPQHAKALAYYLGTFDINSELTGDVSASIDALQRQEVDCVILDMGVPDPDAYETLETVKKNPGLENLPIIIFTGKSLSLAEELKIKKYADSIIVKTTHSYQRMLDEVQLFLHLVDEDKPATHTGTTQRLGVLNQVLTGKTVLVADDDVRNIFALSKALEQYNMTVVAALDGKEALQKLAETPEIDAVLLDMMMPQLDGYETARQIRGLQGKNLPIIALTAKAMTGDREKCIEAGASDYITKPVDIDQLVSLLRVWLYDRL